MNVEKENATSRRKEGERSGDDINSLIENSSSTNATTLEGKIPERLMLSDWPCFRRKWPFMVATDVLRLRLGLAPFRGCCRPLPYSLTSYLPGQEEGNIDFVIDAGFGASLQ
jgi:hypothetical protein